MDFQNRSYCIHSKLFCNELSNPKRKEIANSWFDMDSADYWRHERGFKIVDAIDRNTSWLTIGDGRWGLDSVKIKKKGFKEVVPSDICGELLEEAKVRGVIDEYKIINAEHMNEKSDSVDYIFCKEAYHHFPRPMQALYEMLRVARKGVVLVEPNDQNGAVAYTWEDVGNFIYTLSLKEVLKLALALDLPAIAYYGYNDCFIEGCEFEPADSDKSVIFQKMVNTIKDLDMKVAQGKQNYGMLSLAIFKEEPDIKQIELLKKTGCTYIKLPRNPITNPLFDQMSYCCREISDHFSYYVYGMGNWGNKISDYLQRNDIRIIGYINSDSKMCGNEYRGKIVISPEKLFERLGSKEKIIVAINDYWDIYKKLLDIGIEKEKIIIPDMDSYYLDIGYR